MARPESIKIIWEEHEVIPDRLGHGMIFISSQEMSEEGILAFVDGFEWYHGWSNEVRVLIRKPDSKYNEGFLSELKDEIEKLVLVRKVRHGELTPKVRVWING